MEPRTLQRIVRSVPTSDGAGVRLLRSLGQSLGPRQSIRLDPFLMLDEFSSENADDYVAGFPSHPHRGFETVTYILDGHMLHEDHLGNRGDLKSGGVQWMTAGRGIIHSEMPQQTQGRMRGFQLWLNLPAREKMTAPRYFDLQASDIPEVPLSGGGRVRVIAGTLIADGRSTPGPVAARSTDPTYFDVQLPAGASFEHPLRSGYNAFLYPYEGRLDVGASGNANALEPHCAGFLSTEGAVVVQAGGQGACLLVLAGRPIGEPVVQYGPFVMNTAEEIEQALREFRDGEFAQANEEGRSP